MDVYNVVVFTEKNLIITKITRIAIGSLKINQDSNTVLDLLRQLCSSQASQYWFWAKVGRTIIHQNLDNFLLVVLKRMPVSL